MEVDPASLPRYVEDLCHAALANRHLDQYS